MTKQVKPLGSAKISEETYGALIAAFRTFGPQFKEVGRQANVAAPTAKRAWDQGYPANGWDPIKLTLEREKVMARAAIAASAKQKQDTFATARENAIQSAAQAKAQEGQMVNLARTGALQALTVAHNLAAAARDLAVVVRRKLTQEAQQPDEIPDPDDASKLIPNPRQISAKEGLSLLGKVTEVQSKVNNLAHEAMVMERLYLGEPSQVIGVVHNQSEMTLEELEIRVEMATEALKRSKEAGGIRKVPTQDPERPMIGRRVGLQ